MTKNAPQTAMRQKAFKEFSDILLRIVFSVYIFVHHGSEKATHKFRINLYNSAVYICSLHANQRGLGNNTTLDRSLKEEFVFYSMIIRGLPAVLALGISNVWGASIHVTNLKSFDIPFGNRVNQVAINDKGDLAGTSFISGSPQSGFVLPANGPAVQIRQPGARYTVVNGINNQGILAGYSFNGNGGGIQGFTWNSGTFSSVSVDTFTYLFGIDNNGDLTGYSSSVGDTATGFLIKSNHEQIPFSLPGHALDSFATSVNNAGQVVGYYNHVTAGFLRNADGTFQTLAFAAMAINDGGIIVGQAQGGNNTSVGMVRIGTVDYTFAYPGATTTLLTGINNNNQVAGIYFDSASTPHIFEGQLPNSAPEPANASLVGLGVLSGSLLAIKARPIL